MLKDDRVAWGSIFFILGVVGIYLFLQGPYIHADTPSYKNMDPRRSAGYPFFLYIFRIFGEGYLTVVIAAQILLTIAAAGFFFRYIRNAFNLNTYSLLLLLPPLFYAVRQNPFPREIMTEALAFPIFLFVVVYFLKGVTERNYSYMLTAMLLNVILVLVRGQFLYFYPVMLLGLLHIYYLGDRNIVTCFKYAAILVLLYPATQLVDRTYHLAFHGKFVTSPFGSNAIAANALYVAREGDNKLFEDEITQNRFKEIYDSIYSDTLTLASLKDVQDRTSLIVSDANHYSDSFNKILHGTTTPVLQNHFSELEGIESWIAIEKQLKEFIWPLIRSNWNDFILINFVYNILVRGFPSQFTLIVFFVLFIYSMIGTVQNNRFAIILFYISTFHALHFFIVALGGRVLPRYSFYTEFLLFTFIMAGIIYLCQNRNILIKNIND